MPVIQELCNKFSSSEDVFNDFANTWWDVSGPFGALHHMNPVRVDYILRKLNRENLEGLKILDIGCGGGILSEALTRCGANVTGIDQNQSAINAAKAHAAEQGLEINYLHGNAQDIKNIKFDVICAMEVLEHTQPQALIESYIPYLKKAGMFFFSTINRTIKSYLGAIVAAEYILRLAPRGTHKWDDFIKPSEMWQMVAGLKGADFHVEGLAYNPISKVWKHTSDLDINYIGCFRKG